MQSVHWVGLVQAASTNVTVCMMSHVTTLMVLVKLDVLITGLDQAAKLVCGELFAFHSCLNSHSHC